MQQLKLVLNKLTFNGDTLRQIANTKETTAQQIKTAMNKHKNDIDYFRGAAAAAPASFLSLNVISKYIHAYLLQAASSSSSATKQCQTSDKRHETENNLLVLPNTFVQPSIASYCYVVLVLLIQLKSVLLCAPVSPLSSSWPSC